MPYSELHQKAPELRVERWIDGDGQELDKPLRLSDLGDGYKILFCFQHWCPGCHSRGFPTLKLLQQNLQDRPVGFAVIQTVFEGHEANDYNKLRVNQEKYDLKIPFGQDEPLSDEGYPTFMEDYRSGGTPWFTIIDPEGKIVFGGFHLDAEAFLKTVNDGTINLAG